VPTVTHYNNNIHQMNRMIAPFDRDRKREIILSSDANCRWS